MACRPGTLGVRVRWATLWATGPASQSTAKCRACRRTDRVSSAHGSSPALVGWCQAKR